MKKTLSHALLLLLALTAGNAYAQSAGDYRSAASGNWNDAGTWETYNGSTWVAASAAPDNNDGVITVRGGHTVTVAQNVSGADQIIVEAGGQLTLSLNRTLNIMNGVGVDLSVSGTVDNNGGTFKVKSGAMATFSDGAVFVNRRKTQFESGASLVFNDGSTYEHAQNGDNEALPDPVNTSWNTGSTCVLTGITDTLPGNLNQSFHHFTWNSSGQTTTLSLAGQGLTVGGTFTVASTGSATLSLQLNTSDTFSIGEDFVQSGGTFIVNDGTGSATVDVAGAFSMTGGELRLTTGSGSPTMTVAGAFSQSAGTITETGSGSGTILLDGASTQTVTVSGTVSNDIDFEVDGSGATLASDFTPPHTLTLTTGSVATGAYEIIINGSASISRTSGYVAGTLTKTYSTTGSKVFEVGTPSGYAPVTVNVTAGSGDMSVTAVDGVHPSSGSADVLERYWQLSGPTITGADLTFAYLDSDVPAGANEADFEIGKYNGSWSFPGGSVDPVTNTATITGVTSFSDWTMGAPSLLPVELVAFDALADGQAVLLTWHTASETNNAGFEVQRSRFAEANLENGDADWEVVAFIEGHGTTEQAQAYRYRVDGLEPGRYGFRLKQLDYDGAFDYSPEVEVSVEMAEHFLVEPAYPNPFNPQATLRFAVRQPQAVRVELFDVRGRRVRLLFAGVPAAGSIETVVIDGAGLPSGLYVVRVLGERFVQTQTLTLLK